MKVEDFDFLAALLKERSGLVLTRDKAYLLGTRLMPVARQRNMKGLEELVDAFGGPGRGTGEPGHGSHDHERVAVLPR